MNNSTINPESLAADLIDLANQKQGERLLLGIVGIPGGGKSTLAEKLLEQINAVTQGLAVVAPMDGFHFPNNVIDAMGLRPRKGSFKTFDVPAYAKLLKSAKDITQSPPFPIYDRELHEPRYTNTPEHSIGLGVKIVITEGNYLLLEEGGWEVIGGLLDQCWYLDTDLGQAKHWVIQRHIKGGRSPEDAETHYARNDLPNAEQVIASSVRADRVLHW